MPEVLAYVKNHNLNFEVPYEHEGETRRYRPDYIVTVDDGQPEPLNLVVEIKGLRRDADAAKADTMQKIWIPAVNNAKAFGRWDFLEFKDIPYDAEERIRAFVRTRIAA